MSTCKCFTLDEILDGLGHPAGSRERKRFCTQGFGSLAMIPRGMNGFSYNALLVPESIHVIAAPRGCGRHADFEVLGEEQNEGRIFHIPLKEKDIVMGSAVDVVEGQILDLIEGMEEKPKAVTLMITCMDALLHTDYASIGRVLKARYGIAFALIQMFSFLNTSRINHLMLLEKSIYGLLESSGKREARRVNLIGNTTPCPADTELIRLLARAGYETREIRTCRTFEEFRRMGDSALNVVVNPHAVPAAQMLEKELQIPYVECMESMDPDSLQDNYERLQTALGVSLDYEPHYRSALDLAERFSRAVRGKTFAIGNGYDYNPVKCAAEFARLGARIKYVVVSEIEEKDKVWYEKLKALGQDPVFYPSNDQSFFSFPKEADCSADAAVGLLGLFLLGIFGPRQLMADEEPFDFEQLEARLGQMTAMLEGAPPDFGGQKEPSVYDRDWSEYRERTV